MDEVVMAGEKAWNINTSNWLTTGQDYWTMSPAIFTTWNAVSILWNVGANGYINSTSWTSSKFGIRPVINLKKDTLISEGNGTKANPYVIKD